nr:hypothetical protein [uncultured Eubacterium sp.]
MTTYYGVLFGVISIYISNLRVSGILIGAILGLLVSFALIIYKETENINNFIVLFITFYEITEIIVYSFKFDFYKYAPNISELYADHRTIYFKLVVAFYVTLISYIIINHQEKKRKTLENNKFFWLGIFFIVGAIFANTIHPLDVPDEWEDLCLILLNVNYNRYDYLVPICILLAIALVRMSFRLLRKKGILGENLK